MWSGGPSGSRAADVVMLQLEIPLDAVQAAAEIAADAGVPVILDPAPAPDAPLAGDLLEKIAYLTPNETEAERLAGIPVHDEPSARQAAAKLLACGARCVIITMGGKGSLTAQADAAIWTPAPAVEARDSTAAGDAFNGGLAYAAAQGRPLDEAVRYASLVGALSVAKLGAQPSLPTADEVPTVRGNGGLSSVAPRTNNVARCCNWGRRLFRGQQPQLQMRAVLSRAKHAVFGLLEISFRRLVDVHELLRVAINHGKPRALDLHHHSVPFQEAMILVAQVEFDLGDAPGAIGSDRSNPLRNLLRKTSPASNIW